MKIKLEKKFITTLSDMKIFTDFYNEMFVPSFNSKIEYESLDYYRHFISKGHFSGNNKYDNSSIVLYLYNGNLIGGLLYHKFTYYTAISRLVIKEEFRNQGIGTSILKEFFEEYNRTPTFLLIEKNYEQAYKFFKKNRFQMIDFNYKQPDYSNERVNELVICIKDENKSIINKTFLKNFIYDYVQTGVGIDFPKKNQIVMSMWKEIDKKSYIKILDDFDDIYLK